MGRSLAACELLYNAGYRNLFWVQGGLDVAEEEVVMVLMFYCNFDVLFVTTISIFLFSLAVLL